MLKNNNDLSSSLFSRLHTVETLNRQLQATIQLKNAEIQRMQGVIDINYASKKLEDIRVLDIKNSSLDKKVKDMENWFIRHGMIWQDLEACFDFKKFMNGITRLNESDESKPYAFLAVYKNGYILDENSFSLWTAQKGLQFLQEVMQGKLPTEALENYPQGVRFDVFDRHEQDFVDPDFGGDCESGSSRSSESCGLSGKLDFSNKMTCLQQQKNDYSSNTSSKIGTLTHNPKRN